MERELIQKAQLGDKDAFHQLLIQYMPLTKKIVRTLVSDEGTAEDILQEGWLDVWLGLPKFNIDKPFRPWLVTVVSNRCRKNFRIKQLEVRPFEDETLNELASLEDVEGFVIKAVSANELRNLLMTLSEEQRQLLSLRFYAELKLEEIAEVLNVPVNTIKSKLYRVLKHLRSELEKKNFSVFEINKRN